MLRRNWLMRWLRPIKCANFDCNNQWDGVCYAKKLSLGMYDPADFSSLVCREFEQVEST